MKSTIKLLGVAGFLLMSMGGLSAQEPPPADEPQTDIVPPKTTQYWPVTWNCGNISYCECVAAASSHEAMEYVEDQHSGCMFFAPGMPPEFSYDDQEECEAQHCPARDRMKCGTSSRWVVQACVHFCNGKHWHFPRAGASYCEARHAAHLAACRWSKKFCGIRCIRYTVLCRPCCANQCVPCR